LFLSLAGCMGIDMVMILKKMQISLTGLRMDLKDMDVNVRYVLEERN
jgi:uncharacterized OsmC-like protein